MVLRSDKENRMSIFTKQGKEALVLNSNEEGNAVGVFDNKGERGTNISQR